MSVNIAQELDFQKVQMGEKIFLARFTIAKMILNSEFLKTAKQSSRKTARLPSLKMPVILQKIPTHFVLGLCKLREQTKHSSRLLRYK